MEGYLNVLRSAVLWFFFFLGVFLIALFYPLIKLIAPGNEEIFQKMMGFWAGLCLRGSLTRVRVSGASNIPREKGMVIAVNHSSFIDNLVMLGRLPLLFKIVSARAGFSLPLMGRVFRGAGYIPTGLRMGLEEQMTLYRELKNRKNVLIYSRVARQGEIGEFTGALVAAARETGSPILPVCIRNASRVLPMRSFILNRGEITVRIGEPIAASDAEGLRDRIEALYMQ